MMARSRHGRRGDRYDASLVPLPRNLNAMFPYLMKRRTESVAYFPMDIDAENLLAHIEQHRGTPAAITVFEAFMLAVVATLRARPHMNRYIIGRRLYQRRDVVLSFVAKRELSDDGEETNVMVQVSPQDDRAAILTKLRCQIGLAKQGEAKEDDQMMDLLLRLPRSALRLVVRALEAIDFYHDTPAMLRGIDPLRGSAYIANLGSVGLDAPYHHLFEWGTCSMFIAIGQVGPRVCVGPDGEPAVRQQLPLRFTFDERTTDGFYCARSLELLRDYLVDPAKLDDL